MERSIDGDGAILAVDQRGLPQAYEILRTETVDQQWAAIHGLAIRGAPALGVAGAMEWRRPASGTARRQDLTVPRCVPTPRGWPPPGPPR